MKLNAPTFVEIAEKVAQNRENGRAVSADAIFHLIDSFPDKEDAIQLDVLALITENERFFEGKKTPELFQKVMAYCNITEAQINSLTEVIQAKKTGKFDNDVEIEKDGAIRGMDGTVYRANGAKFVKLAPTQKEKPPMNAQAIYDHYRSAKAQEKSLYSFAKQKLGAESATPEELTGAYMALQEENAKPRRNLWEKFTGFFKSLFNNGMIKKLENKLNSLGEGYTRRDNAIEKATQIAERETQKQEKQVTSDPVTDEETKEFKNDIDASLGLGVKAQTAEPVKKSKTAEIDAPVAGKI